MTARVPDFFLIGAPKCGTTSLAQYLGAHPGVWFSDPKEPGFYIEVNGRSPMTRAAYLDLFAGSPPGALLGEGSARYFRSPVAVPRILADNPAARFIVLLREPLAMLRSLHGHYLGRGREDVEDFAEAWGLQERRARGEAIPRYCLSPEALQYAAIGRYSEPLARLFGEAPRDRILIHVAEEFFADPRAGYLTTLQFLGLPDDGRTEFGVHNAAFVPRLRAPLARLHRASTDASPAYRAAKAVLNAVGLRPGAWVVRTSRKSERPRGAPPPLDSEFETRVRRDFEPEIDRLETMLGRRLDVWRTPARASRAAR